MTTLPTPMQWSVLEGIYRETVSARKALARSSRLDGLSTGSVRTRWFEESCHHRNFAQRLEDAAVAGGVPQRWIDRVRTWAEGEVEWQDLLQLGLPEPESIDRTRLLKSIENDIAAVHAMVALVAGRRRHCPQPSNHLIDVVDRNATAVWHRTVAVAQILEVPGKPLPLKGAGEPAATWIDEATTAILSSHAGRFPETWETYAFLDTGPYIQQTHALSEAGISASRAPQGFAPPHPRRMVELVQAALPGTTASLTRDDARSGRVERLSSTKSTDTGPCLDDVAGRLVNASILEADASWVGEKPETADTLFGAFPETARDVGL
ncbi:hypothetical protein [Nocardia carnea]|uniref:hypothetical protein n=1 Tax=Nocardia carnea TaxID=37328 RepID=UPI0024563898|nr:hypothetical protein [Nocardia carnea]